MNINKINDLLRAIGLFLLANLSGIILLIGLSTIVYGFYNISTLTGVFATGVVLVLISLILAREGGESN